MNEPQLKEYSLNSLKMLMFFVLFLCYCIIFCFLINFHIIDFNKLFIILPALVIIILIHLYAKYMVVYEAIIYCLKNKYKYNKPKFTYAFFLMWFFTVFIFWFVLMLFDLYK